jgi:hypothetical protein
VTGAQKPSAQPPRVVAIGDIHGDFGAFAGILQRSALVDSNLRWTGRNSTLVQTGDFLDRGPQSKMVMDLLMNLQREAPRQGGRVIVLLGNHEAMNIYGDLRYVSAGEYASFADNRSESRRKSAYTSYVRLYETEPPLSETDWMKAHPPGFIEHREAFGPDGKYGKWLRGLPAVTRVNDSIFLHGGISPELSSLTIEKINAGIATEIRAFDAYAKYMAEQRIALPFFTLEERAAAVTEALERKDKAAEPLKDFLTFGGWLSIHPDGPLWFRGYAQWTEAEGGALIQRLIDAFGADRFVVGHTTQPGKVVSRFEGKVHLIDTGMLAGYVPGGRASALVIQDGNVSPVY